MRLLNFLKNKTDIIKVIKNLPNLLSLKPATKSQIEDAENKLELKFSNEYRIYIETFGSIIANGIELSGIANAKHRNVIFLTQQGKKLNPQIPKNLYVIEDTRVDGIIIWQDSKGFIYQSYPNNKPKQIYNSLKDYILNKKL